MTKIIHCKMCEKAVMDHEAWDHCCEAMTVLLAKLKLAGYKKGRSDVRAKAFPRTCWDHDTGKIRLFYLPRGSKSVRCKCSGPIPAEDY